MTMVETVIIVSLLAVLTCIEVFKSDPRGLLHKGNTESRFFIDIFRDKEESAPDGKALWNLAKKGWRPSKKKKP